MLLGLSETLSNLVSSQYAIAKAAGSVVFAESERTIIKTSSGASFQLRYCPSLAKKPTAKTNVKQEKKFDPFDNPTGDLFIAAVPVQEPTHVLVLNKFPIISNHFILATKVFKQQTDDLEMIDLDVTYACLKAWEEGNEAEKSKRLFAFFNSGTYSGASQPHRHIQFLPVESILEGYDQPSWTGQLLALLSSDPDVEFPKLPFKYFMRHLPLNASASVLQKIYHELLQSTYTSWFSYASLHKMDLKDFSYNIGMTTSAIILCPRISEGVTLRASDGSEVGTVALNGSFLSGGALVKRREEWEHLRMSPSALDEVLVGIGVPLKANL